MYKISNHEKLRRSRRGVGILMINKNFLQIHGPISMIA